MRLRLHRAKNSFTQLFVLTVLVLIGAHYHVWRRAQQVVAQTQPGLYKVVMDIDGDTIIVNMNGTAEKVRFIGVDTPETHDPRKAVQCYGPEAAAFTKRQVEGGVVRLSADPLSTNRDRYGRLLRYVFLQDGRFLNEILIQQGYGFAYTGFPFDQKDRFLADEQAALGAKRGLWQHCRPTLNPFGGYTSNALSS